MSEQTGGVTPENEALKQRYQLELWRERQGMALERERQDMEVLNADPSGPMNTRQRLAYARVLAQSDIVPAGFRAGVRMGNELSEAQLNKAAASIVLATEIGAQLGMGPTLALMHLQVVEGNVQLKPASARGLLLGRGCTIKDYKASNRYGIPTAHRIEFSRPGWTEPALAEFTLEDAARARLVEITKRDNDGEPMEIKARSKDGKALPWELYTADMLRHRCTSRVVNAYAMDLTAGLDTLVEDGGQLPERVHLSDVAPDPDAPTGKGKVPADYDYVSDLDLLEEARDSRDWRPVIEEIERTKPRRRTKVQMAAARLAAWAQDWPMEASAILAGAVSQPVDAEIVEDDPVATSPPPPAPTGAGAGFPGANPDDPTLDDAAREPLAEGVTLELERAWQAAADVVGDLESAREAVFAYVRTELPDATGLAGPDDLRADHVRMWLRMVEPGE